VLPKVRSAHQLKGWCNIKHSQKLIPCSSVALFACWCHFSDGSWMAYQMRYPRFMAMILAMSALLLNTVSLQGVCGFISTCIDSSAGRIRKDSGRIALPDSCHLVTCFCPKSGSTSRNDWIVYFSNQKQNGEERWAWLLFYTAQDATTKCINCCFTQLVTCTFCPWRCSKIRVGRITLLKLTTLPLPPPPVISIRPLDRFFLVSSWI